MNCYRIRKQLKAWAARNEIALIGLRALAEAVLVGLLVASPFIYQTIVEN